MFPPKKDGLLAQVENLECVNSYSLKEISSDELAYRIMEGDKKLQIFDFRTSDEYRKQSLPNSILFSIDNFFEKEPNRFLSLANRTNVFIANDEIEERKIAIIAKELGYNNIKILTGGFKTFDKLILNFDKTSIPQNKVEETTFAFRDKASLKIPEMIKNNKPKGGVQKKLKRAVGGC